MRDDCMITENGLRASTTPAYGEQGNNINPEMNVSTRPVRCLSCGKTWTERWQNGVRIGAE